MTVERFYVAAAPDGVVGGTATGMTDAAIRAHVGEAAIIAVAIPEYHCVDVLYPQGRSRSPHALADLSRAVVAALAGPAVAQACTLLEPIGASVRVPVSEATTLEVGTDGAVVRVESGWARFGLDEPGAWRLMSQALEQREGGASWRT